MRKFGIIGYGKLGKTLALKLADNNQLDWICSASKENPALKNVKFYSSIEEIKSLPDIIFITKADNYIKETAEELSLCFATSLQSKIIIHCSAMNSRHILQSCALLGATTSMAHPYQTFFNPSEKILENIGWAVDAGNNFKELDAIIALLGGKAINTNEIPGFSRELYHASAVIASNFLNTIISLANQTAANAGVDGSHFIPQILRTTLENNLREFNLNSTIPLTGPIVRADFDAIKKHLEALRPYPILFKEYCQTGLTTAELAYQSKLITSEILDSLRKILNNNENKI